MSLMGLNKGKNAEREVIREFIRPIVETCYRDAGRVPPLVQRNTLATAEGGHDVSGCPGISIEVKFQKELHIDAWWRQTIEQAYHKDMPLIPVLFYRANNIKWRVRTNGYCGQHLDHLYASVVDVSVLDFQYWYFHLLSDLLKKLG